jgi:HK97 family phage portal protein
MKIGNFYIGFKAQTPQVVVNEETLFRMLYETMSPFLKLRRDSNLLEIITEGYEQSPDVFSIVNKVSTMFSRIPYKVMQGEKEIEQGPIEKLFEDNPADYTFNEYRNNWESMGMTTGNSITYFLKRTNRDDVILLQLMPSQHTEIMFGNWLEPIKGYKLDLAADDSKIIPPENVWHVRQFANLDFREGKNYMGLSPIRVAAKIINSQIYGQEIIQNTYKRGMPPGILYREDAIPKELMEEARKQMEEAWDRKYNRGKAGRPIFAGGKMGWLPIGFSSFTDLKITEINTMALRTLCNVWGIPSRIMNDMDAGSYNKDKEDRKAIYTNRLIPDNDLFWAGINKMIKNTGITYVPDYSAVPELQDDKKDMATIFKIGYDANAVQVNEFRTQLQLEPDPQMEGLYRNDVETNPNTQIPPLAL